MTISFSKLRAYIAYETRKGNHATAKFVRETYLLPLRLRSRRPQRSLRTVR